MKDVDDDLHVIDHDPLARRKTIHRDGANSLVLFETGLDLARNRFEMRFRRSRAEHKEIREGRDAAKIQHDDLLRLFIRGQLGAGFR